MRLRVSSEQLEGRYTDQCWRHMFDARAASLLAPWSDVLDVGGGRHPCIPATRTERGASYTGFDVSLAELDAAPEGSYTAKVVGDISIYKPALVGRFDLALSWQVLEHVWSLDGAIGNLQKYLRTNGVLLAVFSGRFAFPALVNQAIPNFAARWLLTHFNGRSADSVFPAYYHRCWYDAIERIFQPWLKVQITPIFAGGHAFRVSRLAFALYLRIEDKMERKGWKNLASNYLVEAVK